MNLRSQNVILRDNYANTISECGVSATLRALVLLLVGQNFVFRPEPVFILVAGSTSALLVQFVRTLPYLCLQVNRRRAGSAPPACRSRLLPAW